MKPEDVIESIHTREEDDGFDALSLNEKIVFVIASADFEVNLGGAAGYLYNSAGDRLPNLVAAFETVGCPGLAAASKELATALTVDGVFPDRATRHKVMDGANDTLSAHLAGFESAIQDQVEDYGSLLDAFIRNSFLGNGDERQP